MSATVLRWTSEVRQWPRLVDQVQDALVDQLHTRQGLTRGAPPWVFVLIDSRLLDTRSVVACTALRDWSATLCALGVVHAFGAFVGPLHARPAHHITLGFGPLPTSGDWSV